MNVIFQSSQTPKSPSIEESNLSYDQAQDRMRLLPNYYRWIINTVRPFIKGQVVELGSGAGHVIQHYLSQVEQIIAVDFNDTLLHRLETFYPKHRVVTQKVDLRRDWTELQNIQADTVIALDVLEHFEDDIRFIASVQKILRPHGHLILKVPAQSILFSEMDRASGHYRRYDDSSLRHLMTSLGFNVIFQQYINPLGALFYRFKNQRRSNFSKSFSQSSLQLINRLIPVIATLDKLPKMKGLSLVGVYAYPNSKHYLDK